MQKIPRTTLKDKQHARRITTSRTEDYYPEYIKASSQKVKIKKCQKNTIENWPKHINGQSIPITNTNEVKMRKDAQLHQSPRNTNQNTSDIQISPSSLAKI